MMIYIVTFNFSDEDKIFNISLEKLKIKGMVQVNRENSVCEIFIYFFKTYKVFIKPGVNVFEF